MTSPTLLAPLGWIKTKWQVFLTQRTITQALQRLRGYQKRLDRNREVVERSWERWEFMKSSRKKEKVRRSLSSIELDLDRMENVLAEWTERLTPFQELVDPATRDERLQMLLESIRCLCGADARFIDCHGKKLNIARQVRESKNKVSAKTANAA